MKIRGGRGNKYRAKVSGCQHGHVHPSIREANRCNQLHLLVRAGEIVDLVREPQFWFSINGVQVKHLNGRRVGYKGDFGYTDVATGRHVVEDAKGVSVRDYVLRIAIARAMFPHIDFREV
ncbi:DUF1064 domain-containing protein [Sphingobium yanoikuyae]|uniref:DUF1064 domain-containing protein n=1 Tax=Sphingobium yanoikuyae TaxID=13690 RepID=UPI0035C6E2BF